MVHKNAAMTKFFVVGAFLDVVDGVTNHPFLKPFYDIYIDQGIAVHTHTYLRTHSLTRSLKIISVIL